MNILNIVYNLRFLSSKCTFFLNFNVFGSSIIHILYTGVQKLIKYFRRQKVNPLITNDLYSCCTAPLTSKRCILYIYSTNTVTKYFKHGIYSPFFSSSKCSLFHNSNVFGSCIINTLYIYSIYIGTKYFTRGIYSPFFPLENAICMIILTYLVRVFFTFYLFIEQI